MEKTIIVRGTYFNSKRTFPDLNDYVRACRAHWSKGRAMVKEYAQIASFTIQLQARNVKFPGEVSVEYTFYEADGRRDMSNVSAFFIKVFEDALQQCGTIVNDNQKYMKGIKLNFGIDKNDPRVEVKIKEISDEKIGAGSSNDI